MRRILSVVSLLAVASTNAWAGLPPTIVTPEPATIALMGGGLALVGALAWRRNKKK